MVENTTRKYLTTSLIILFAYGLSALAWWRWQGAYSSLNVPFEPWVDKAALLLILPGWLIVTMIKGDGPGTGLTDVLIPMLNGIFWGLLILATMGAIKFFLRRSHQRKQSIL